MDPMGYRKVCLEIGYPKPLLCHWAPWGWLALPPRSSCSGCAVARSSRGFIKKLEDPQNHGFQLPYAPCMVYLPTFEWFLGQMLVNIPYMEHMALWVSMIFNVSILSGFLHFRKSPNIIYSCYTSYVCRLLTFGWWLFWDKLSPPRSWWLCCSGLRWHTGCLWLSGCFCLRSAHYSAIVYVTFWPYSVDTLY